MNGQDVGAWLTKFSESDLVLKLWGLILYDLNLTKEANGKMIKFDTESLDLVLSRAEILMRPEEASPPRIVSPYQETSACESDQIKSLRGAIKTFYGLLKDRAGSEKGPCLWPLVTVWNVVLED
jgi:hypothetical protein